MTDAGFTKGPWAMAPETNGTEIVAYSADPWRVRALIARGDFISCNPNWKNDTALWTAAPELFDALTKVRAIISEGAAVGFNPHDGDWAERLFASQAFSHAAVTKATGETK